MFMNNVNLTEKVRKVKPYLCSDCGTTNIKDFYETSKGKCKSCQYQTKKKLKINKPRKIKPYLCKHCGTTDPQDFEIGLKTTCHACEIKLRRKTEPRKVKPHLCSDCGTINIDDFSDKSKGLCKSCQNKKYYKPVTNRKTQKVKYNKPYLCRLCGTTDITQFYNKKKGTCKPCHLKIHRKTDRILKPTGIIIPDHITDQTQREKYYKEVYAQNYYIENKTKIKEQRKINKRKKRQEKKDLREKIQIEKQQQIQTFLDQYNFPLNYYKKQKEHYGNKTIPFEQFLINKNTCHTCKKTEYNSVKYYRSNKISTHPAGFYCQTCMPENTKIIKNPNQVRTTQINNFKEKIHTLYNENNVNHEFIWNTFKNKETPMTMICQKHGEFQKKPRLLETLRHCPKCQPMITQTTETIIQKGSELFPNQYDYSKVNYINKDKKVTIICKKHNHEFEQIPKNHFRGNLGCMHCQIEINKSYFQNASEAGKKRGQNVNKELTKFTNRIRSRINNKLRQYLISKNDETLINKNNKYQQILGTSFPELKKYIESKWEPWMNWNNYGLYKTNEYNVGWDIDHIIPTSSANTKEELLKLLHHTNLQPLCSNINRNVKRNLIIT